MEAYYFRNFINLYIHMKVELGLSYTGSHKLLNKNLRGRSRIPFLEVWVRGVPDTPLHNNTVFCHVLCF